MNDKGFRKKYDVVVLVDTQEDFLLFLKRTKAFSADERVQVIIVDRSDNDSESDMEAIAREQGMEYHRIKSDVSIADAYNQTFEWIDAEFVCFTDARIYYDEDVIKGIDKALYDMPMHKIAMCDYAEFDETADSGSIETSVSEKPFPSKFVMNERESVYLFPYAYFFSTELIGETRFKDVCEEESAIFFLLEMLLKVDSIAFAEGYRAYYTDDIKYDPEEFYGCRNKKFYIDSVNGNYLDLLRKYDDSDQKVPVWLQKSMVHLLYFKIFSNYQIRDKLLLIDEELKTFFSKIGDVLQYVDDDNLIRRTYYKKRFVVLPVINLFVYLKYRGDVSLLDRKFSIVKNTLYFTQRGKDISLQNEQKAVIQAINYTDRKVEVEGFFHTDMLYQYAKDSMYSELNEKKYNVEHTDIYSYEKCFGVSIDKKFTFKLTLDKTDFLNDNMRLCFCISLDGQVIKMPMTFFSQAARLNENYRNAYWIIDKEYYIKYEAPYIKVIKADKKALKKMEEDLLEEISIKEKYNPECEEILKLRKEYHRKMRRLQKKKIWIHHDKMYKAGDNGEYLFRFNFASSKKDGTDCYFIISPESNDYQRLKKEFGKHVLEYGSFECRLYSLCAQVVISTAQGIFETVGFNKDIEFAFRDLFNAKLVQIYHGVTMQKVADSQNRLKDNVMLYCTCSQYEADYVSKPVYGYNRQKQIALTGMARFDGLRNKEKKQILITPTWRPHLTEKLENRVRRGYFDKFRESEYFKIYNRLINDQRMITAAQDNGYSIIFLIHTGMTSNMEDYDKNDHVIILRAGKDIDYETILTESALMVTDYSGVQYDFAYMKKPVIYFQPKELPPRLKNGAMKYEAMGFGPVTTLYDDAVDHIIEYMEEGCIMKPEYINRVEDFFEYMDFDNCKRLHDAINEYVNNR